MPHRRVLAGLSLPLLLLLAVLVPAGSASAAGTTSPAAPASSAAVSPGHAGGRICGARYCIYAYVDGAVHADALTASGTVKVVDAGVPIARLQVDRVTVGTPFNTIVNGGPKNLGTSAPVTQNVSATVEGHYCQPYLTTVFASGRLSDSTLIKGSVSGIVYYSDYGICPGPTLSTTTVDIAPTLAAGGARTVRVVTNTLDSNDHTRAFASVRVTLIGVAGTNRVLRASIDDTGLQSSGTGVNVHQIYSNIRSGADLAPGATVTLFNRTYAALWPKGCDSFYNGANISTRFSNGDLFHTVVPSGPYRFCH